MTIVTILAGEQISLQVRGGQWGDIIVEIYMDDCLSDTPRTGLIPSGIAPSQLILVAEGAPLKGWGTGFVVYRYPRVGDASRGFAERVCAGLCWTAVRTYTHAHSFEDTGRS